MTKQARSRSEESNEANEAAHERELVLHVSRYLSSMLLLAKGARNMQKAPQSDRLVIPASKATLLAFARSPNATLGLTEEQREVVRRSKEVPTMRLGGR